MNIGVLEILLGLAIIVAAALCCYQFLQFKSLKDKQDRQLEKQKILLAKGQAELKSSVRTLCLCLVQKQVDLSEGCWRVKLHLDHLYPQKEDREDFLVFYQMFDEISHFATHEKRNDLSNQERFNQDKQRFEIEGRYQDQIEAAAKKLLTVLDQ